MYSYLCNGLADLPKESPAVADDVPPSILVEGSLCPPGEEPEDADSATANKDLDKENEEGGEKSGDSSDEDDLTVTIGELKKAAEVMTPGQQQHQARFQPKVMTLPSYFNT